MKKIATEIPNIYIDEFVKEIDLPNYSSIPSIEHGIPYILTKHAQIRIAQRGLARQDIDYVLQYGYLYDVDGAEIYFLRNVDIPEADRRQMKRLEGTAVIVAPHRPFIITAWRNLQHGSRNIRHKLKQIWRRERRTMG